MTVKIGFDMKVDSRNGVSFENLAARLGRNSDSLEQSSLNLIATTARANAPIGQDAYFDDDGHEHPGWLQRSIQLMPINAAKATHVKVRAFYGIYVEQGTRHMRGQPFFRPAVKFVSSTYFVVGVGNLFERRPFQRVARPT